MERLKPIDLERKEFRKRFRGYDTTAVRQTLDEAATEIAALLTELKFSREENERIKFEIEGYRLQESALRDALVLAQKSADETRAVAHKEAEILIDEAKLKAAQIRQDAEHQRASEQRDIDRLIAERRRYEEEFAAMLESYLRRVRREETNKIQLDAA